MGTTLADVMQIPEPLQQWNFDLSLIGDYPEESKKHFAMTVMNVMLQAETLTCELLVTHNILIFPSKGDKLLLSILDPDGRVLGTVDINVTSNPKVRIQLKGDSQDAMTLTLMYTSIEQVGTATHSLIRTKDFTGVESHVPT